MSQGKLGHIIIIVAPSGSGKSTLISRMKEQFPQIEESVSYTTREPRKGEENGKHYFFVSREEFLTKREKADFLEWAEVHGNLYGTEKRFVESKLKAGADLLFDLDVQGTDSFKSFFGDKAKAIFIAPPSADILEQRLRKRGTDSTGVIQLRVQNSRDELKRMHDYDYLVVNDDLEVAYNNLIKIVNEILSGDKV